MSITTNNINQLRQSARIIVRELGLLNDAYCDIGVTLAERHLLIELSGCESPTMSELCERLLIDKSTVSRLISKAVKKGYVKCVIDKLDKRKRLIKITEIGKQVLNAFEPIAFRQTKDALLNLSSEDIKTVYQGIELYAQGLRSSRLQNKVTIVPLAQPKIESLPAIYERLSQLKYTLEIFTQADQAGLYQIFKEVVDSYSKFPYECSSIEEFQQQFFDPHGQVYVCHSFDGDVIGGFYLKANFPGRSDHIANAAYMISNTYRGKGIGSLLIKASLHFAKVLGFKAMQFNMVLSENNIAVELYKKMGFNIVGTIPQAVRNQDGCYQDGYIMYRTLTDL